MHSSFLCIADDHFANIILFPTTRPVSEGYYTQQNKELVVLATNFSVISGHLYKMGTVEILHIYVSEFERASILIEIDGGVVGGHYVGRETSQKILRTSL